VAFFIKYVKGSTIFYAGVISQLTIFVIYYYAIHLPEEADKLGYLWLNAIGTTLTILLALIIQLLKNKKNA
jgi:NADH:ubiquinone oxidoreductase subunit 6 (subunit J)